MKTAIVAGTAALILVAAVPAGAQDTNSLQITRAENMAWRSGPAEHFTGTVHVGGWFQAVAPACISGATVAFERGARTHWHVHPLGQTLVVTAGTGRVQRWGGPVQEIRPGDVVRIPPGVKHWHGASPDVPMTHVALVERLADGPSTEWMEEVTDDQYAARPALAPADSARDDERSSRAHQLMADIAPTLADLTDDVLYGQVWSRPGLSRRDRSLVTVSALIAMNRPDQLRSHIALARNNGVTEGELIETITHLAFYAGWPSAVTAIGVAREVFNR